MPYAHNNQISRAPIEGGIEISEQQYQEALAGMVAGRIICIDGGFSVVDPPDPEPPEIPEPEPLPPQYPRFSAQQILDLFTEAERRAITEAAMVNVDVKMWYDRNLASDYVTYEDPRTEEGFQALVDAALLAPERKAAIVATMQPPEAAQN